MFKQIREGWINSDEMGNAMKHGYTFTIIKGYEFKKGVIFKEFVETLYNLRLEYPKTHPMNYIAKTLMNSLYGMKMESTEVNVFNCSDPKGLELFNFTFELRAEGIKDLITVDNYS